MKEKTASDQLSELIFSNFIEKEKINARKLFVRILSQAVHCITFAPTVRKAILENTFNHFKNIIKSRLNMLKSIEDETINNNNHLNMNSYAEKMEIKKFSNEEIQFLLNNKHKKVSEIIENKVFYNHNFLDIFIVLDHAGNNSINLEKMINEIKEIENSLIISKTISIKITGTSNVVNYVMDKIQELEYEEEIFNSYDNGDFYKEDLDEKCIEYEVDEVGVGWERLGE